MDPAASKNSEMDGRTVSFAAAAERFYLSLKARATRLLPPPASGATYTNHGSSQTGVESWVCKEASMILGMTLSAFTLVHIVISVIGIGFGLLVMYGLLIGKRLDGATAIFLVSTVPRA
jgi:hypothetical protein